MNILARYLCEPIDWHFFILVTETNDWYAYLHNDAARLNGILQLLNERVARKTPASAIFGSIYLSIYRIERRNETKRNKIKLLSDKYTQTTTTERTHTNVQCVSNDLMRVYVRLLFGNKWKTTKSKSYMDVYAIQVAHITLQNEDENRKSNNFQRPIETLKLNE